ncbi:DUF2945 domain-containing protein [Aspergillus fischeri NRRL 181]|uniref:Hypervirulence associated protein TUDOR domain-containing protein n=1 Tax=Neosartorya fischeri (strain ATCC 1020 / DSM 3700 / CBS 544.65 / FGSC A1164 / JCM 1740 / NRRL 181 / WB 181) TaxID=331117 RepID=A1DC67_NEOFI|nr:conserved hypothetical protein [Aspergillus fischeri NRRL 181]EAW19427.1 conserved hypothetical protein [Aspergillus fischeri NRRL 181]KAG2014725.1 hypothetical protein GB937_006444 [Aspergillus fischeri]
MSVERVKDKKGENINEGDHVYTRYRGGSHEGEVEKIVMDQAEADEENVANPPKKVNDANSNARRSSSPINMDIGLRIIPARWRRQDDSSAICERLQPSLTQVGMTNIVCPSAYLAAYDGT